MAAIVRSCGRGSAVETMVVKYSKCIVELIAWVLFGVECNGCLETKKLEKQP